jgi:hypothetical protein
MADYSNYIFDFNTDFSDHRSGVQRAKKALAENGVIVIKNYFSREDVQPLSKDIAAFADAIEDDVRDLREYETEKFILTYRGGKLEHRHPSSVTTEIGRSTTVRG